MHVPTFPASVTKITIYQHCDAFTSNSNWGSGSRSTMLSCALALRSFSLEELVICNIVDGRQFFEQAQKLQSEILFSPLVWADLRILTLTSDSIEENKDSELLILLRYMAYAARRMPRLKIMEVYNADGKSAGLFQYMVAHPSVAVSWISTWQWHFTPYLEGIWDSVSYHKGLQAEFTVKLLGTYSGPAHFVSTHLATPEFALHPSSL